MRACPKCGWTVAEMLVVIVIIGLLAAVGASKYAGVSTESRRTACIENQLLVDRAVRAWEHRHGELSAGASLTFDLRGHVASASGPGSSKKPSGDAIGKLAASPDQFVCPEHLSALGGRPALTDAVRAAERGYTWLHATGPDPRLNGNRAGAFCIRHVDRGPDGTEETRHR